MTSGIDSSPSAAPFELQRTERYVLHDTIARGGMASVHIGVVEGSFGFSRVVAIKRLHPAFAGDRRFVTMLIEEAHTVSRIRHLNVVPTLDVIAQDGDVFVIMEYVKGASLTHLLRQLRSEQRFVDVRFAIPVLAGVLRGLHAAHVVVDADGRKLHIVHCDVSPQNILVGVGGLPRVIDFGVATARGNIESARAGEFKGKLGYAAPEQLTNRPLTPRTDVFAAGIVLWELLTNAPLFAGETDLAVYTAAMGQEIQNPLDYLAASRPKGWEPRMHEIAPLAPIAMRALQRDSAHRFRSAKEMALELERVRPATPLATVGAWVREVAHAKILEEERVVAAVEAGVETRRASWTFDEIPTRVL